MAGGEDRREGRDRSSVLGWLGGYLVAAWVAIQVTDTLGSLVGLPLWFGQAVVYLLAIGLVVVVATAALQSRGGGAWARRSRLRAALTWRRTAVLGLMAFAVLGMGTAGHMAARVMGVGPVGTLLARGVLDADEALVLADLQDHTSEPGLARATTQALRVHLSQSPTVRLASTARVADALELMNAPADSLDLSRAREVAIREGLKAVLGGEIHRVGSRYTVSVRLVAAESGAELLSLLETADEPDGLIPAVERLSLRVRERIGESLASVRRSPPLSRVRTASLAALKSYTQGTDANGRGEFERCALLMDEAIALDSTFATAYVGRAACNQNLGRLPAQQVTDRMRAYEMRDRMTEEERLRFTAIYHQFVTDERRRAVEAWEAYSARYPDRASAHFALANLYAEGRDWARAETTLLRGMELEPSTVVVLINLAGYRTNMGRFDDAEAAFDRLAGAAPGLDLGWRRATLSLARARFDRARVQLDSARERARGNPGLRAIIGTLQAFVAQTQGRAEEAERLLRDAMAADLETGAIESYHLTALALAKLRLETLGDTAAAVAGIDDVLAAHPLESLDPLDRSTLDFAAFLGRAGRTARAERLIANWERDVAPLVPNSTVPAYVRAAVAEGAGRWRDAIAAWHLEDDAREDPLPALVHLGRAWDRLGEPDSAIAYYGRYLTTPSRLRYETDPAWRGPVLERLAELHESRGEAPEAARYYAMLAELWADADELFQARARAARARIERLLPEG